MADIPLDPDYGSDLFSWNHTEEEQFQEEESSTWILGNIFAVLLIPAVIISNFMLFIIIVTRGHLRSDTWRILIAHTSACIVLLAIFMYSHLFTEVYSLPSLHTTVICPGVLYLEKVLGIMVTFCLALVSIERFRSLKLNQNAGITTKPIVITLLVFWGIVVIIQFVSLAIGRWSPHHWGQSVVDAETGPGVKICRLSISIISGLTVFLFEVFALLSNFVVIIGIIWTICKHKPSSELVLNAAIAPLVYGIIYLCYLSLELVPDQFKTHNSHKASFALCLIVYIAFPVMWLVTWSLTGDISWKLEEMACYKKKNDEELHLLQNDETSLLQQQQQQQKQQP